MHQDDVSLNHMRVLMCPNVLVGPGDKWVLYKTAWFDGVGRGGRDLPWADGERVSGRVATSLYLCLSTRPAHNKHASRFRPLLLGFRLMWSGLTSGSPMIDWPH